MTSKDESGNLSDSQESKELSSTASSPSSPSDLSFTGDENEEPTPIKSGAPVEPHDHKDDEDDEREVQSVSARRAHPKMSLFKRLILLIIIAALVWLFFPWRQKKPKVIYASRYSKEFKYRPAASPIITETLKDGRIRIRGAAPTTLVTPTPTPTPVKRKTNRRKRSGIGKSKRSAERAKRGKAAK